MANIKIVDADKLDSDLTIVADAIRAKGGTTDDLTFPNGMKTAIENIKSGGGASTVKEKDVNFYDYDGTLLHSYTVEEAQALSELPELPEQEGLICQGWNWTLEDIKAHNRAVDVGATYITDDGKTRLYIKIAAEGRMDVPLYFSQTVANGVTIDWGDGSATETLSGTGNVNTTHTYANIGDYVISLDVADGCTLGLGRSASSYCVLGVSSGSSYNNYVYLNMLQKVEIGKGMTNIADYAFQYCYSLISITIPNNVTFIGQYAFRYIRLLKSIVLPNSFTQVSYNSLNGCSSLRIVIISSRTTYTVTTQALSGCSNLARIILPYGLSSIGGATFYNCYSLANIVIPKHVTYLSSSAFSNCYGMKFIDFSQHESIPTLQNITVFEGIPSDFEIRVPAALYDEWKAATNWSTYANQIVGV